MEVSAMRMQQRFELRTMFLQPGNLNIGIFSLLSCQHYKVFYEGSLKLQNFEQYLTALFTFSKSNDIPVMSSEII